MTTTPLETRIHFMSEAISEARNSEYHPTVGAVVVKNDEIVGRGYRQIDKDESTGSTQITYAEIKAIEQAGEKAQGATLYTTLEPCITTGRAPFYAQDGITPVQHILRAGIRRVIVGMQDMGSRNTGKGIAHLIDSGINVEVGVAGLGNELRELYGNGVFYF